MSELKRGPSFKSWKIRYLLDVAGTERVVQTRRPIKPQPIGITNDWDQDIEAGDVYIKDKEKPTVIRAVESRGRHKRNAGILTPQKKHPTYPPGSYYVRERVYWPAMEYPLMYYAATRDDPVWEDKLAGEVMPWEKPDGSHYKVGKLPAMFMPRRAARLRFDITDVRVERLGDISRDDALYEGVKYHPEYFEVDKTPEDYFNEFVIPSIYDDPAEWWWVYEGTVDMIEGGGNE